MAAIDEWARNLRAEDLTVNGLARLEAELFRDYPDVQRSITRVVEEFAPVAREIEQRHDGRRLMAPVVARHNQDVRQSRHFLLSLVSFVIVALPAVAWGISLRGTYDYMTTVSTVAALLAITAALCIIKVLSTLRDRVWVGVMTHWAVGAAVVSALTLVVNLYVASLVLDPNAGVPMAIISASALIVVGFGILALVRASRSHSCPESGPRRRATRRQRLPWRAHAEIRAGPRADTGRSEDDRCAGHGRSEGPESFEKPAKWSPRCAH